jgi:hypothetical protein
MEQYRQPLFPTSINVTEFKVFVYPNIDYNNAWKASPDSQDSNLSPYISPYIILNYKIRPSREAKKRIKI